MIGKTVKGTLTSSNVDPSQARFATCAQAKKVMVKTTELRIEVPRSTKAFYCVPTVKSTEPDVVAYKCTFKGADTATFIKLHLPGQVRPGLRRLVGRALPALSQVPEPGRADAGERRDQRQHHQHPPGRGDQQGAEGGDREEDVARTSASQRRRQASRQRPSRPKPTSAQCRASQPGSRITSRGPCDQIRPTLVGEEAGVFERLFGDVVPELLAAHPRQRLVGFQVRVAGGGEPGEDLLQPQLRASAGAKSSGWRATTSAPTFSGSPSGGQVGAGEEHLPPPVEIGTTRSSATALRIVQGRPRRRPRRAGSRPGPAPAASRRRPAGEDDEPEQEGDAEVLGPDHRRGAEQAPGGASAPSPPRSLAQNIARTEPDRRVAASGSLISIPWYSSSAG